MSKKAVSGPRCVALVGPYLSGKTTLLESILSITGATRRKGAVAQGNSVGDSSAESRSRQMSVELNVGHTEYLGDDLDFLDCPGSVEFQQDMRNVIVGVDAAVVVIDAEIHWPVSVAPVMKMLEKQGVPTAIFVNKIDHATGSIGDLVDKLRPISDRPLVLRHLPVRDGETVTGYIDLASERAYVYKANEASELVELSSEIAELEQETRFTMMETLADWDDDLMEKLLEDVTPEKEHIYKDLTEDFQQGLIVPVFMGAAQTDAGVRRLLKALRHEVPEVATTAARAGVDGGGAAGPVAQVLKTFHVPKSGKLSLVRVLAGEIKDGDTLNGERISGVSHMLGAETKKLAAARVGDTVALGRLEKTHTGDVLVPKGATAPDLIKAEIPMAIYSHAVTAANRNDEVKLMGAFAKVIEEDPSLSVEINDDTHQMILWGQGEVHLRVAGEKLKNKYNLTIETASPKVPYKEAIKKGMTQRGRFKRQTGGHGQFGDCIIEIKPRPRGSGFEFTNKITGGAIPRQYIPSVEFGVKDYLTKGPLGFQVVDVSVTLVDGSFHAVDSSDIAFRTAGRIAMSEAMPQCNPVLLEPVLEVEIFVPSEFTAKVNAVISSRRGQILGFEPKEGWAGWDMVKCHLPQDEVHDLIVELRSLSHGSAFYVWKFDHLVELVGRVADQVLAAAKEDED